VIFSRRSNEGYVCIDHTESPGFDGKTAALGARLSLQKFIGGGQKFEAATNTCSHCEKVVVQNPNRTRPRGHCSQCDRFICDPCSADFYLTSECRCWEKRASSYFDQIMKGVS
jgi:hypothetical protein